MIQQSPSLKTGYAASPGTNGSFHHGYEPHSQAMRVVILALNRNYQAIHVVSVRRAFCLLYKDLAEVIHVEQGQFANYDFSTWQEASELKSMLGEQGADEDWIHAVHFEIQIPRIIRLIKYDRVPRNTVKFNRRNIFLRDEHCCQYCGNHYPSQKLSLDHVFPRSRGGPTNWENIVCACVDCNVRKGGRTPIEARMLLLREPTKPARSPLLVRQLADARYDSWRTFLPHAHD